jgi:hypothetical protein
VKAYGELIAQVRADLESLYATVGPSIVDRLKRLEHSLEDGKTSIEKILKRGKFASFVLSEMDRKALEDSKDTIRKDIADCTLGLIVAVATAGCGIDHQDAKRETLRKQLHPVPSHKTVQMHIAYYTKGTRKFVQKAFQKFLQLLEKLMWIQGDAGVGKSVMSAMLCESDFVIGAHFCQHDKPRFSDPNRVLTSLAWQLALRHPDYLDKLSQQLAAETQDLLTMAPSDLFELLFVSSLDGLDAPLVRVPPEAEAKEAAGLGEGEGEAEGEGEGRVPRVVLLIDALDETANGGDNKLLKVTCSPHCLTIDN